MMGALNWEALRMPEGAANARLIPATAAPLFCPGFALLPLQKQYRSAVDWTGGESQYSATSAFSSLPNQVVGVFSMIMEAKIIVNLTRSGTEAQPYPESRVLYKFIILVWPRCARVVPVEA